MYMQRIKKSIICLVIVSTIIIFSAVEGLCGALRIDDYSWDSKSQSFKMQLSTQAGKVSAVNWGRVPIILEIVAPPC